MIPLKDDNPVERFPLVTVALVAANALAFGWQVFGFARGLEQSVLRAGAIPYEILTFTDINERNVVAPPLTILSSMFLHGGLAHLGGNMLMLSLFGGDVEDALGRARALALYLLAGIAGALAQIAATAWSGDPAAMQVPMVGASGAIAGLLAAYLVLCPRARVLRLAFAGAWVLLQLLSVVLGGNPGVAFVAHVGGFAAGLLLVRLLGRPAAWRPRRASG